MQASSAPQCGTLPSVTSSTTPGQRAIGLNSTDEGDFGDDTLNEVIMAVDVRSRGTVGCAYYVAREEKLYFMEDVKLGGADIVEARQWPFSQALFINLIFDSQAFH